MKKNKKLLFALLSLASLASCSNNTSSSGATSESTSIVPETSEASSVESTTSETTTVTPETSKNTTESTTSEEVTTSEETSSSTTTTCESSSTLEEKKSIVGTWVGSLAGYDGDDAENYDDIENVVIVINEDFSGSYRGKNVTWTYVSNEALDNYGWYRFYEDEFDVSCKYVEETDKLTVKWRNMEGDDYKLGTFSRQ